MWKRIFVYFGLLMLQGLIFSFSEAEQRELADYLPDHAEFQPWEPEDDARTADGETLFMLIDGAAEMYFEYGFKRAIFQSYAQGDEWIDVEIYEMEDAVAAYGLQSIKQGDSGEALDIGQEAYLEEYYLNFRKGNVQVSLVGQDDSDTTVEALIEIARAVERRIPGNGEAPEFVRLITELSVSPRFSVYVKGLIGLSNYLPIFLESIAGFDEGVIAGYDDFTLTLLNYPSSEDAAKSFDQTAEVLRQDFETTVTGEHGFSVVLDDGTMLSLQRVRAYIIVSFGENMQQAQDFGRTLETLLK